MAEIGHQLYQEYLKARAFAKQAQAQADELAAEIKEAAGTDTELTVNGLKIGGYEYINKFPVARFLKERPELAEQFMVLKAHDVFDEALLKRNLPDLYREYQTRQLQIEG